VPLRKDVCKFALVLAGLVPATTATAQAHHLGLPSAGLPEAQVREAEAEVLGPEHAAEHAAERTAQARERRHWRRLSGNQRRRFAKRELGQAEQFAVSTESTGPATLVGRWTHAPFQIPHAAVNAAMLPTGAIMFWGPSFPNEPRNRGNAALWYPGKGFGSNSFTEVPPPSLDPDGPGPQGIDAAPLFCSGASMLASGEVLIAGGTYVYPDQYENDPYTKFTGIDLVLTFNPWTKRWTEQPRMNAGRWYPGQVLLADGRSVFLSGYTEEAPGGVVNRDLEVFTPAAQPGGVGSVDLKPSGERLAGLYPHLITLPDSNVLLAGPARRDSAVLNTSTFTWEDGPRASRARVGGNAILNPGPPAGAWTVTQIGGYDLAVKDANGNHRATASSETINANPNATGGWKSGPSMHLPRAYQNTVLLPDRTMVAVGGNNGTTVADGKYAIDPQGKQRQVELYNPATKQWRLGPAEVEDRGYHSTAVLMPNGKVWSAGDNKHPVESDGGFALTDTAEIYSPPYMFKGPRPLITSAPGQLDWGEAFSVGFDTSRPSADKAVLIAPGSTTHGDDSNQRLVTLKLQGGNTNHINLVAPPSAAVAPPGYYMLFILHGDVPSVAKWVRLG
jgi:hypothetical protein